jgi:hypothetical protein
MTMTMTKMMTKELKKLGWWSAVLALAFSAVLLPPKASGQDDQDDPPTRVARIGYMEGSVSFLPAGETDWVGAGLNRPMTTGDQLWADQDSRAELQLGSASIRLSENTGISFLNLDDNTIQVQLTSGMINISVRRLSENDDFEIDTPNQAFTIMQPGRYRVEASADGSYTVVSVRVGEGQATGGGETFDLRAGQRGTFSGTDALTANVEPIYPFDPFDTWSEDRDHRYDFSRSAQYLSHDVVGYDDLDDHGDWRDDSNYGHVWFPQVEVGWAPYHTGHWDWIDPWGYTWVDDSPWGYAPFHYGRWVSVGGRWGWIPGPIAVQAVYAPALVVFIGAGGGWGGNIGWFALGPREVWVPSYHVSAGYMTRLNVSNTTVSTTVITNVYNTTIVNNTTNITNITYANRTVQGAVTAVPQNAFASAQPVAQVAVAVNAQQIASSTRDRAGCGCSHAASGAGSEGFYCGPCGCAAGSSDEPAGGREEDSASASARAVRKTAAGAGSASWAAHRPARDAELASDRSCRPAAKGDGGASRQTRDADRRTTGESAGAAECCAPRTIRPSAARHAAGESSACTAGSGSTSGHACGTESATGRAAESADDASNE